MLGSCLQSLSCSVAKLCPTPYYPRLLCPWDFPRQEYWHGLPFPSSGDLPDPGIEPTSPALAGGFFITEPSGKPSRVFTTSFNHEASRLSSLSSSSDMAIWRFVLQLFCCLFPAGLDPWRREWQPTAVHGVARSQTQLSNFTSL